MSSLMSESVIDHAGPVIDHTGNRLQSVIDHRRQQGGEGQCPLPRAAGRVELRRIAVSPRNRFTLP
jgi:hypothetical protein